MTENNPSSPLCLDDVAAFGWDFGMFFFLQTAKGNFLWSDPDYGGDGTIKPFPGTLEEYCLQSSIPYVRDKGSHIIRDYCGDSVKIVL